MANLPRKSFAGRRLSPPVQYRSWDGNMKCPKLFYNIGCVVLGTLPGSPGYAPSDSKAAEQKQDESDTNAGHISRSPGSAWERTASEAPPRSRIGAADKLCWLGNSSDAI
jgi:hypothetical protein